MSNFSILTNSGAYVALANLGGIQSALGQVQKRISTGLQVADATDNGAVFAVAQGVRASLQQYNAVNTGLNNAASLVQTALVGATSISNLLPQITATLTRLADGTISDQQRQTYTAQLKSQVDEVQTYISAANYNGVNLLEDGQTSTAYNNFFNISYQYSNPINGISILSGVNGQTITVQPAALEGAADFASGPGLGIDGLYASDGFLGLLANLSYYQGNYPTNQQIILNYTSGTQNLPYSVYAWQYFDINPGGGFLNGVFNSRPVVYSNEAIAALGPQTAVGSLYVFSSPYGTFFTTSSFDASVAYFTQQVDRALGSLGATSNNLQLQLTFNQSIADTLTTGLGNLVDANLAKQSAQLTALQSQQQLAIQSLSIANAQPQTILSLFR